MMITEIEDPLSGVAEEAVRSLISHYCQDVHLVDSSRDAHRRKPNPNPHPQSSSRVVNHWSEKLAQAINTSSAANSHSASSAATSILGLYPTLVRGRIVTQQSAPTVSTFDHGEDHDDGDYYCRSHGKIVVGKHSDLIARYFYELVHDVLNRSEAEHEKGDTIKTACDSHSLSISIIAISEDIVSLTAAPSMILLKHDQSEDGISELSAEADRLRNITMPYLLDIISTGINLLRNAEPAVFDNLSKSTGEIRDAVMAAAMAAASFTSGSYAESHEAISPETICPILGKKLSLSYALRQTLSESTCTANDVAVAHDISAMGFEQKKSMLEQSVVFLSSRLESPWSRTEDDTDAVETVVEAAAKDLLLSISNAGSSGNEEKQKCAERCNGSILDEIMSSLLANASFSSECTRSHFFGRGLIHFTSRVRTRNIALRNDASCVATIGSSFDSRARSKNPVDDVTDSIVARNIASKKLPWSKSSRSKDRYASGRGKATLLPESRAHVTIPSRLSSVIRMSTAIIKSDVSRKDSMSVLANLLPITYCLMDSIDATEQTIGGAMLSALFDRYSAENWRDFASTADEVLSQSLKTGCSDAAALAVLSRASFELDMVQPHVDDRHSQQEKAKRRRKVSLNLLEVVHKSRHRSGLRDEESSGFRVQQAYAMSALLGGLHPFFRTLARMPETMAASAELVRPGLGTLLPLLGWELPMMPVESRKLQISILVCLEELMVGGHPLVPRHGGKIMSELLGCIIRARMDIALMKKAPTNAGGEGDAIKEKIEAAEVVESLSLRVAHVALSLCGGRAKEVLEIAENESKIRTSDVCDSGRSANTNSSGFQKASSFASCDEINTIISLFKELENYAS